MTFVPNGEKISPRYLRKMHLTAGPFLQKAPSFIQYKEQERFFFNRACAQETATLSHLTEQSLHPVTTDASPSQHTQRAPPRSPLGHSKASATTPKSQRSHTRTTPSWEDVANASDREPHATETTGLLCDDDTCRPVPQVETANKKYSYKKIRRDHSCI